MSLENINDLLRMKTEMEINTRLNICKIPQAPAQLLVLPHYRLLLLSRSGAKCWEHSELVLITRRAREVSQWVRRKVIET